MQCSPEDFRKPTSLIRVEAIWNVNIQKFGDVCLSATWPIQDIFKNVIILTSFFFKIRKLDEQVIDAGGGFQTLGPFKRIAEYLWERKAATRLSYWI